MRPIITLKWQQCSHSLRIRRANTRSASAALGIDWMDWRGLTQAIPPAYSHYLGRQIIAALEAAA